MWFITKDNKKIYIKKQILRKSNVLYSMIQDVNDHDNIEIPVPFNSDEYYEFVKIFNKINSSNNHSVPRIINIYTLNNIMYIADYLDIRKIYNVYKNKLKQELIYSYLDRI